MAYFDKDFNQFYKDLAANNNRDWFHENKKRYEKSVKEPFKAFVEDMIGRMKEDDPEIDMQSKDAIFRINRDIRFSKDKTPYKTMSSAMISRGGKKNKSYPGIYFEMGPGNVAIYGGCYMLDKEPLSNLRHAIANDLKGFQKALDHKPFKEKFDGLHGDVNKRIDKDLVEAAEKQPLIYNKGFYYYAKFDPSVVVTDENLAETFMNYYQASAPIRDFLTKGTGL